MQPTTIAELRDVTKRYGQIVALDGLNLDLDPGHVTAILGPNGAGKTTAVKLLLGLLRPTRGTVRLFDGDPRDAPARRRTGVMLQVSKVPETLRVREHIHLFCSYYPSPMSVDAALAARDRGGRGLARAAVLARRTPRGIGAVGHAGASRGDRRVGDVHRRSRHPARDRGPERTTPAGARQVAS